MIAQLSLAFGSCLVLALLGLVVKKSIVSQLALRNFKKRSKGLPLYADYSFICNHSVSMLCAKDPCNKVLELWKQDGHKTRGYLFHSRPAAMTIDLDLIKTIVIDESTKHINRIPLNLTFFEVREDNLMLAEDDQWRRLRRAFSQALKASQFKSPNVVAEIDACIAKLIQAIERELDQKSVSKSRNESVELDLKDLAHKYALSLIFSNFYKQHNLISFEGPCYWANSVNEINETFRKTPILKLGLILPELQPIIDWLCLNFHRLGKFRLKMMEFVQIQSKAALEARRQFENQQQQQQKQRRRSESKDDSVEAPTFDRTQTFTLEDGTEYKRNMIDCVIDQYLDGKITKSEYINSSVFLLNAANLTSADTIIHTLYVLAIHQDVQDKLRKSIASDGTSSEYLTWVINESLRLRPPAPIGCSRTITRDIPINGGRYLLPAGTFVTTPNYCIHRLKEYWGEDADEFKPDRWRDTSHHHPLQFIPFGAGARRCPGEGYAMFEIRRLLVVLLSKYRFDGEPNEDAYKFDSPYLIFLLGSRFRIRVRRLN